MSGRGGSGVYREGISRLLRRNRYIAKCHVLRGKQRRFCSIVLFESGPVLRFVAEIISP
jgi:hypothetical protein